MTTLSAVLITTVILILILVRLPELDKKKHPRTYEKITEGDSKSISEHNGHGNAIAMVYSHPIMPLADRKDKITQVKWGVDDFKYNFGRDPEGIWLPETACNEDTIDVLIEEGIRYIMIFSGG